VNQLHLIDGIGLWAERRTLNELAHKPALFLDRDGVIVEETHYLGRVEDVAMVPGVAEAVAKANARSVPVILVTNQAGIARGFYGWEDFGKVQAAICAALAEVGAELDLVLACGYHNVGSGPLAVADHPWRKPNDGMLAYAAEQHAIALERSWIIGDKLSDISAGAQAGLAGGFLVRTGHGAAEIKALADQAPAWRKPFSVGIRENAAVAIEELLASGRL